MARYDSFEGYQLSPRVLMMRASPAARRIPLPSDLRDLIVKRPAARWNAAQFT